ncbi:hypothetical protein [Streptomyces sp. NPDC058548]|uniref:hypothetical protein n=1 Tax=Streptomyces sp. NPDC058548 TaxID=3346545 RepID=UPI003664FCA8
MSQMLQTMHDVVTLAAEEPVIPGFTPSLPGNIKGPTGQILGWTAGAGLSLAVLGGLLGWGATAIGHNSERAQLAARGKTAIVWSLLSGGGIGVTAGLVWAVYNMTQAT